MNLKVVGDIYKNFIIGDMTSSEHRALIEIKNPLILRYIRGEDNTLIPVFSSYDSYCNPPSVWVRPSVMYDANELLIRHYKEHCAKIFQVTGEQ